MKRCNNDDSARSSTIQMIFRLIFRLNKIHCTSDSILTTALLSPLRQQPPLRQQLLSEQHNLILTNNSFLTFSFQINYLNNNNVSELVPHKHIYIILFPVFYQGLKGNKKIKNITSKKRFVSYLLMYFLSHLGGYFEQTRLKTE